MTALSVADDQLRSFFERWNRLEEEKTAISEDLKALFAEAKGAGFDTKAMRVVFRERTADDRAKLEAAELDQICDLYRASLGRARPANAPARTREKATEEATRPAVAVEQPVKLPKPDVFDEIAGRAFPEVTSVKVYFVAADEVGLIKIGSSGNVDERVYALMRNGPVAMSLIGVIGGGPRLELELHQRFSQHRVRGEWFSNIIRPEIDALVAEQASDGIEEFPSPAGKASVAGHPSADHVRPPASQAVRRGCGSANTENDHVDRSAPRAGHAGHPLALAGQVESQRRCFETVDRKTSLAAREGEKPLHSIPPSPQPSSQATAKADDAPSLAASSADNFEPPAFLRERPKPVLRPNCLKPDNCGSYGAKHCGSCERAARESEAA